jgi:hypothetical protein
MPGRRRGWFGGISQAEMVRRLGLEHLLLSPRKMQVVRSTPTRQWAIHCSMVRLGLMRADDPNSWVMPFFNRPGAWQGVETDHGPVAESRSTHWLFTRHRTIYHLHRGGTLSLWGWAIELMPILVVIGVITWPIRILVGRLLPLIAPAIARSRERRKLQRDLLRQVRQGESCPQCGYDLRASLERCPECGTAFVRKTVVVAATEPAKA